MRDKRAREARTWLYPLLVLALGGTAILTSGCGGSSSGNNNGGRSAFQVTAAFAPYTGRDIQGYVGSIKVTAQTGTDSPLGPFTVKRGDAPLKIDGVAAGKTYTFTVEGVQATNGTGSKLASAQFTRMAPSNGQTTDVAIDTTTSEIASVSVSPSDVTLTAGATQAYTFEAKNAAGAVILTGAQDRSFSVSVNPNVGTFDSNTNTYTAPGVVSQGQPDSRLDVTIGGKSAAGTIKFDAQISTAMVGLKWNADGRGLPGYAESAKVVLIDGAIPVAGTERVVNRSSRGAYTESIDWPNIKDGTYNLVVEGYGAVGASGNALASASFPITVGPNEPRVDVDMSTADFKATKLVVSVQRGSGPVTPVVGTLNMNEGEDVIVSTKAVDAAGTVYLVGNELKTTTSGNNVSYNASTGVLHGTQRGSGSSLSSTVGDALQNGASGTVTFPINVVFGNPGVVIGWDSVSRDAAPGYANSFAAVLTDSFGNPVPGFPNLYGVRPSSIPPSPTPVFWPDRLPDGDYIITVILYAGPDASDPATRGPELMRGPCAFTVVDGTASPCTADFPSVGEATNVEMWITRANGSIEKYLDVPTPPPGRRNGPLFMSFGETVSVTSRATNAAGTTTYFSVVDYATTSPVDYDSTTSKATAVSLGLGSLTADAAPGNPGRGPLQNLEVHVLPPAVVAFSDYDENAFGTGLGAVTAFLYVPGARVNSPLGNKIWQIPYRDDSYIGRAVAQPLTVLPTGTITGYDVLQPAVNSRGNLIALVVSPFDTISGNLTYYKDIAVMEVSYDSDGAPVFGAILPQNTPYDSNDQFTPGFGPQTDTEPNGILYFSSMQFDRNTGAYLGGEERDIYERTDVFATSSPGTNMTSGLAGDMFWPAIAPDNGELAVIRKIGGDPEDDAQLTGTGQIVTLSLSPFAPSGEQIDMTAALGSRIGYVASKGLLATSGVLIDTDRYFIAFARSFNGGTTTQAELIRAERTQAALGGFVTQQLNASDPFCAAIDGSAVSQFKVTNPRRVMAFVYNNTQLRVKNITSPSSDGIGTEITTLNPVLAGNTVTGGPVWPAPFDVFDPLPR